MDHGGHVYVFGGETFAEPPRAFDTAERFDSRTGRWEALARMPTRRHGLGAAVIGNDISVVSGGLQPAFAFGDAMSG